MDNKRIAGELVKLAKSIVADYNDRALYINLYDIVGGRNLITPENGVLQSEFNDAVDGLWENKYRSAMVSDIKKALKRNKRFVEELESQGGEFH